LRHQFTHVIDMAPTILEAAGLPEPTLVNGVLQSPMEGTSMLYSFGDAKAPERHDLQYFEMGGNRGIYYKGWSAVTKHKTPWILMGQKLVAFDDDVWELYDGKDWSQAATWPGMPGAAKLQRLFDRGQVQLLLIDDCRFERPTPRSPVDAAHHRYDTGALPGMKRLSENSVIDIKNRSFSVTGVDAPTDGPTEGVLVAQGGRFGGGLYRSRTAKFVYNLLGLRGSSPRRGRSGTDPISREARL
jgi:arylsulfatase